MFDALDDTIIAVSSPPGFAPRGIVRCSGPGAILLALQLFKPETQADLSTLPGFSRIAGLVELDADCTISAEMYLFRAPRSYTRQDCVEFHVPGSPALLDMLVRRCLRGGARPAQPGEFTARAFLNGAMDLTRAESVAAVIRARSDAQLRAAHRMTDGRLAGRTRAILDRLAELLALVEADIDFAEEPIEFITPGDLKSRLADISRELSEWLNESESSQRLDVLPHILLIGRSNAGKSTLMNLLSGLDRSICSPVAGTTRDLLYAPVQLTRREAVLFDSAGVQHDASGAPACALDSSSSELVLSIAAAGLTHAAATRVDAHCLVIDLTVERFENALGIVGDDSTVPCVIVANKIDMLEPESQRRRLNQLESLARCPIAAVSAKTGAGIDRCREMLSEAIDSPAADAGEHTLIFTARQRESVHFARDAVARCIAESGVITETIDRADVLAFELRDALDALASITGAVTTDDLLARVFASFCIGK